jgi:hypothetical protein
MVCQVRIKTREKMKNKVKAASVVLFLSVFILIISFGGQKAEWKGKIEVENGIKVIINPKEPIYGKNIFILTEELSIGKAGRGEEYIFSRIRSIAVDEKERIYVLDTKEAHVKVFDKNGDYIKTMGRKGQGPGEMNER